MGIVFRQSIKTTLVTFTGAALGTVIVLASTTILSQPQYGFITTLTYLGAIIQLFLLMGTANLVGVYTQRYESGDVRRKALFTIGLATSLFILTIFTTLFILAKERIISSYQPTDQPLIREYFYFVPLVAWFISIMTLFDAYLVAHVKVAVSAFSREVILRLANLLLLALVFSGVIFFNQYVVLNVFAYLIPIGMLLFFAARTKGFGLTANFKIFSKSEYKDMLHFSWYHLLTGSLLTILNTIDTLMLAPLDDNGMASSAIYNVAIIISSFMFMPFRAMANSTSPILNEAYIRKDMGKVHDLFKRAGMNILIAGVGMFIVIAANLDNATIILKKNYGAVKYVAIILMIGKLADMAAGVNNELLSITKYYKFNYRLSLLLLLSVVLFDWIFIPIYGIYGAAWVSAGTLIIFNIIKTVFLYRKFNLHPFSNRTWLVLVAGIVAAFAGYFWPWLLNPYIDAIIRSIVIVIVYALMLLWLKPSEDLVTFIASVKKDKRLF